MDAAATRLGPFRLEKPIGRGGMGEVWKGTHVAEDVPVAVKLITAERARQRVFRDGLRNEVRAMARLDHPGIVVVLDYGDIPADAEARSGGRLVAGSPYFVMELMEGGTLKRSAAIRSWDALRGLLFALLDALAHAHARGVVHRDIKPSNVLLAASPDGSVEVKLGDFGIAHALSPDETADLDIGLSGGTPSYMAPEQITESWREHGPWTDLYAVGCLTYTLAAGGPPFRGATTSDVCRAHCVDPIPELRARFAVPRDLDAWLRRMLAKRPARRFASAADAAHGLMSLDDRDMVPASIDTIAPSIDLDGATLTVKQSFSSQTLATIFDVQSEEAAPARAIELDDQVVEFAPPPMPRSWRVTERTPYSRQLLGAGLGLYGLRPIPMADRQSERDALWSALRAVREEGRPQTVVLRGLPGHGKSRLAEWLGERARELGLAEVLRATHGPTPGPTDGVPAMLATHFRCQGLDAARTFQRLAAVAKDLGGSAGAEADAMDLARLLAPTETSAALSTANERHAIARRWLSRVCESRPAIVVFDDVQWGADAISFAEHLVRHRSSAPLPVLLVLTARTQELDGRPSERAAMERLEALSGVRSMDVEPLSPQDHEKLVADLLGLDGEVARQVADRTSGNALFAVQLVGDWVQRGLLVPGERGFSLRSSSAADLPDDIHGLWSRRLDELTASLGTRDDIERALELAAALGQEVVLEEWVAVCRAQSVALPDDLLDTMANQRLARVEADRWSFVHGMLRESLERRATEAGRWQEHHRACARALQAQYGIARGTCERIGRHLLAAEELADALEPLRLGAREALEVSEFVRAHALLEARELALAALRVPHDDTRWAVGFVTSAVAYAIQGLPDEAQKQLDRGAEAIEREGSVEQRADLAWVRGGIELKRGEKSGMRHFEEALRGYRSLQQTARVTDCLHGLGECYRWLGDLAQAEAMYREAADLAAEVGETGRMGRSLGSLAGVMGRMGRVEEALESVPAALEQLRRAGMMHSLAVTVNSAGDLHRQRGDLARAEELYRESIQLLEELASEDEFVVHLNLGLTLLARGLYPEAREAFEKADGQLVATGRSGFRVFVRAGLLPSAAHEGEWARWDTLHGQLGRDLKETSVVDEDLAWCFELAAELAARAGEAERSASLYRLALRQWETLGRDGIAAAIRRRLGIG